MQKYSFGLFEFDTFISNSNTNLQKSTIRLKTDLQGISYNIYIWNPESVSAKIADRSVFLYLTFRIFVFETTRNTIMTKPAHIRLRREVSNSFIYYKETKPFSTWHYHPEYELVLITQGKGKRIVGDHVGRFENDDLVLVGANIPHEWMCTPDYFEEPDIFKGEGIVIQFVRNFLGEQFMNSPENRALSDFLTRSIMGIEFLGETKRQIIRIMHAMEQMNSGEQLYALFDIFRIFITKPQIRLLTSAAYVSEYPVDIHDPMQRALRFILQNFQHNITIEQLLQETNMSNTAFSQRFKQTHRMTFKEYLQQTRIGYACKLLQEHDLNIAEIAYQSGFENISNFNRQFKKIKGITPTQYQNNLKS